MGERKVLNKYYPPDFDPAKIPKRKQLKNLQMKVRMMLPMSICCNTCGTFMYKGTKFNCRKEDVVGDTYLGLMKFRFYFKCTKCSAEMIMKTDPKNSDYEMEHGASRNFEPWREADEVKDAAKKQREEEEMGDAMKALENRTMDSKMEMDILAGLDEVKSLKSRQAKIDQESLLDALKRSAELQQQAAEQSSKTEAELDEEDEKLIKSIVFRNSQGFVKRIDDDDEDEDEEEEGGGNKSEPSQQRTGVLRPSDVEAPKFTLQKSKGKREVIHEPDAAGDVAKRLKSIPEMRESEGRSNLSAGVGTSVSGTKLNKPPSDILLIKKVEETKPVFEVKPVKVAFAVKEKKKGPPPGPSTSANAQSNGGSLKTKGQPQPLPSGDVKVASPPKPASTGPGGLALLSGYADSDEGSD